MVFAISIYIFFDYFVGLGIVEKKLSERIGVELRKEMEPIHSDDDYMEASVDESSKQLDSPYLHGINGDPEVLPRVGDLYQADIPVEYDRLNLIRCSGTESYLLTFGLPIPLMWSRSEKFRGFREAEIEKGRRSVSKSEPAARVKPRSIVLALPCQRNAKINFEWLDKSLSPFPGTLGESWEDSEQERFLLGLYCLGKNLVLVQRFVGTKKMGDMLSYYYGSFYRSNQYRRWVDGRKSRSRRSVQGHKLLTGWRQQEMLSRISAHVSEECKSMLLKASKAFREDRIALEEYVFTLKNTVGVNMLTEAIGIGKGKKDLTCALEPTKLNPAHVRIGNDLPIADIVKFLTGEYRMSKTRSSDLFWEAVWPRLLARGWHSEQPKDGPKNSLVFLIPGANKFSRRKMSKGNHYFDSLTDVLNKVALDPTLLELQIDEDQEKQRSKEEPLKNDPPVDLEEFNDSSQNSKKKKKRYLQPRSKTSKSQEVTMFTIVDTSEANGVEGYTLKELRSLPVETGNSIVSSPSYLSESEDKLSEESENKAEMTAKSMASSVCGGGSISSGKSSSVNMDNERRQKSRKGERPRKPKLLPVCAKSSSLADCTLKESGCFGENQYRKKMRPNPSEADQNVVLMREDQDQTLKLSSTGSSAEDSSCGTNEDRQMSPGRQEIREDFDLNVAQISPEREPDGTDTVITNGVHNSDSSCAQQSSVKMECKPEELHISGDLLSGRRQSTRTRPLTTKALEAFAFGYLGNSKKKRKATDESRTKSTKRIRRHSLVSSGFRNGTVEDGSNTDGNE